jgi:hypothetical protein
MRLYEAAAAALPRTRRKMLAFFCWRVPHVDQNLQ